MHHSALRAGSCDYHSIEHHLVLGKTKSHVREGGSIWTSSFPFDHRQRVFEWHITLSEGARILSLYFRNALLRPELLVAYTVEFAGRVVRIKSRSSLLKTYQVPDTWYTRVTCMRASTKARSINAKTYAGLTSQNIVRVVSNKRKKSTNPDKMSPFFF